MAAFFSYSCLSYHISGQPVLRTECRGRQYPPPHDQQMGLPLHVKLTVDPLHGDCRSAPPPRINRGDRLCMQKWKLTVDPLWGNRQSPPGSTEAIAFAHKSESWLLILSEGTVDSPRGSTEAITFAHESESWLLILSMAIVDQPPTDFDFLIFNIKMCIGIWDKHTKIN